MTKSNLRRIKECEKEIMTAASLGSRIVARRQSTELTRQDAETVARIDRIIERNIAEIKRLEGGTDDSPKFRHHNPTPFRPIHFFSIEVAK